MKLTKIYQTLEDRGNKDEVEIKGPFWCSLHDENGKLKEGVREPWLGEGYYFWDTRIEDAKWWGDTTYTKWHKNYIVCETEYDQHSSLLLDLLGDVEAIEAFVILSNKLRKKKADNVKFTKVLHFMKSHFGFQYSAVRALPYPIESHNDSHIIFPNDRYNLYIPQKVQICFFDKTLLKLPFKVVYESCQNVLPLT